MAPLRVEIGGNIYLNNETLGEGDKRIKPLGGNEALIVERLDGDEEDYIIGQIDMSHYSYNWPQCIQNVVVGKNQPSGHFYIADTEIRAEFVKEVGIRQK